MKISITEHNEFLLEEVFNSITLRTPDGEILTICMRDSGFEFTYQGKKYFVKEGYVEPFNTSIRGNELVDQHHVSESTANINTKISPENYEYENYGYERYNIKFGG
jgi:hypothetical protein